MSSKACFLGIALAASVSLGGCISSIPMPQFPALSSGTDKPVAAEPSQSASTPQTQHKAMAAANMPPLPVRNERLAKLAMATGPSKAGGGLSLGLADLQILTAASAPAPSDTSQWSGKPVAVYTQLAQQIHSCWLNPGLKRLEGHGFHAEVGAGEVSEARIIIFKKDPDNKRGLVAFRITIDGRGEGSTVKTENRRLDAKLEMAFRADLIRWSQGKRECKG